MASQTKYSVLDIDITDKKNLFQVWELTPIDLKHRSRFKDYAGEKFVVFDNFGKAHNFKTEKDAEAFCNEHRDES